MARNCIDILKNSLPDIHKYLEEKNGVYDGSEKSKSEWIKAAKELQDHSVKTLNDVYADLKIPGFEKTAQPKVEPEDITKPITEIKKEEPLPQSTVVGDNKTLDEKQQELVNELPKQKVNYKDIKGIGDLSIYLNNPDALNAPHLRSAKKIYEDIKSGKEIKDTPSVNEKMELMDGQNRIVAQLAAGIENVDVAVIDKSFYENQNKSKSTTNKEVPIVSDNKPTLEEFLKTKDTGSIEDMPNGVENWTDKELKQFPITQSYLEYKQKYGEPNKEVQPSIENKDLEDWHNELKKDKNVFWHGSPSGDLRGAENGLHIGSHEAAKQALEARIGVKADGTDWNGTEEYGKTKLAGKKTLAKPENKWKSTGFNSKDVPEEDYYPSERKERAKYSGGTEIPETAKPNIQPVRIKGEMSNTTQSPHEDFRANGLMKGQLKKGTAKRGYYYENVGEDAGSISAVLPNSKHLEIIERPEPKSPPIKENPEIKKPISETNNKIKEVERTPEEKGKIDYSRSHSFSEYKELFPNETVDDYNRMRAKGTGVVDSEVKKSAKEFETERRKVFEQHVDDVAQNIKDWGKKFEAKLPKGTKKSGIGFDDLVDAAAKIVKTAHKVGGDIVKAVDDAIEYIRNNWDKAWGKFDGDNENFFRKSFERINPNVGKEVTKDEVQDILNNLKSSQPSFKQRMGNAIKNNKAAKIAINTVKKFHPFIGSAKNNTSIYNDARLTAIILRKKLGDMQHNNELAAKGSMTRTLFFDGLDKADQIRFIANLERDVDMGNPELNKLAKQYKDRMDNVFGTISSIKDIPYIEDYFPHFWKDPEKAKKVFSKIFTKSPLEGSKSFLKKRFYSDIIEGMKNGLELVSTNPEDLARLAEINANKFKMANDLFDELRKNDLAKYYKTGSQPEGWSLVDDPLFKRTSLFTTKDNDVAMKIGGWYMPKDAADVISRYSSRGLQGNVVDIVRGYNNMLNQAQLGISFFHGMTTTIDAAVTANALGIDNIVRGKVGSGLWQLVKGVTVIPNMVEQIKKGGKVIRDYQSGVMNEDVERMIIANARTGFDAVYQTNMLNNFRRSFASGKYGKALLQAVPAGVDLAAKPIFDYLVPRLKVGGFIKLAQNELSKLKNPSQELIDRTIQKTWDDIENRLGQMTYDNLFWDKTSKDVAFLITRSVGWNLGTARAFAEGITDIPSSAKSLVTGKGISPRTAWLIALTGQTALMGAATTYLLTGQSPQDWRDYFYPRTGAKNSDGTDERIQYPTYLREAYNLSHKGVFHTVSAKASPLVNEAIEIFQNKDFYNRQVYDPLDPAYKRGLELLQYGAKQFIPFGFRETPGKEASTSEEWRKKFGITNAPKDVQAGKDLNGLWSHLKDVNADFQDIAVKKRLKEISVEKYNQRYQELVFEREKTYNAIYGGTSSNMPDIIMKDFERTKDPDFLPPQVKSNIMYEGQSIELTNEQHQEFSKMVDEERTKLVKKTIEKYGYLKGSDKDRTELLKDDYEEGRGTAKDKFMELPDIKKMIKDNEVKAKKEEDESKKQRLERRRND